MDFLTGNSEVDTELNERFAVLPPSIQHILRGNLVDEVSSQIAVLYRLDDEKREALAQEIGLILLVIEPRSALEENLMTEILLAPSTAKEVARFLDDRIFNQIKTELENIYKNPTPQVAQSAPAATKPQEVPPAPKPPAFEPKKTLESDPPAQHTLIKNLQAALKNAKIEKPYEESAPRPPSYNAMLDVPDYGDTNKPPSTPQK